jgi:hypothetical protein
MNPMTDPIPPTPRAAWRLQRARIYEAAVSSGLFRSTLRHFHLNHVPEPGDLKCLASMLRDDAEGKKVLDYVARMENRHRRTYYKAIQELEKLQAARRAAAPPAAQPDTATQPSAPAANTAVAQAAAACASDSPSTKPAPPVSPKLGLVVQSPSIAGGALPQAGIARRS